MKNPEDMKKDDEFLIERFSKPRKAKVIKNYKKSRLIYILISFNWFYKEKTLITYYKLRKLILI